MKIGGFFSITMINNLDMMQWKNWLIAANLIIYTFKTVESKTRVFFYL